MEIITRAEAKERGLKHYFTGQPCKHGHVTMRVTVNATCVTCYSTNRAEIGARYRAKNLEECRAHNRKHAAENRKRYNEVRARHRAENPHYREHEQEYLKKYRREKPEQYRAAEARRRKKIKLDTSLEAYLVGIERTKPW